MVRIITVPPAESTEDQIYHDGTAAQVLPYDPNLWDRDCVFYPREWSQDPDLDLYDDSLEDCIDVHPAGTVVAWIQEQGWTFVVEGRSTFIDLTPEQETAFRARWLR
jgi:hypothetical protein